MKYLSSRLNMFQSEDHCDCCRFKSGVRDPKTLLGVIKELDYCLADEEKKSGLLVALISEIRGELEH